MRVVAFSICACLAWPVLAADRLADCAAIDSAVARLDCYDRLASRQASQQAPQRSPMPASEPAAERADADIEDQPQQPEVRPDEERVAQFGKPPQRDAEQKFEAVEASIESVRKGPLGKQIMTLSNGQIWMENEPGRRRIEADQQITIRKHRWHYEMELASQPNVTVRRVD